MADKHRKGKGKKEEEPNTVFEQHIGENVNVSWVEPVSSKHVRSTGEKVEQ